METKKLPAISILSSIALIATGIIIYFQKENLQHIGWFVTACGFLGFLYLGLEKIGFFEHRIFQKINDQLKGAGKDLDIVTKIGVVAYLSALAYIHIFYNLRISIDQAVFLGVFAAALLGRVQGFLRDWIPFLVLVFAYDSMRGVVDNAGLAVNYLPLIQMEKLLFFGNIPTLFLQDLFYQPGLTQLYDIIAVNFYFMHFTPALLFAGYLWWKNTDRFIKYRNAIILLVYMALITFLIFPSAPPWMAAEDGYINEVHRIRLEINDQHLPGSLNTLYLLATSNEVAAIPSLHAALPFLMLLYAIAFYGKKGYLAIIFPLGISLSAVYLGEHYVIDILIGFIYAAIAFYVIQTDLIQRKLKQGNLLTS